MKGLNKPKPVEGAGAKGGKGSPGCSPLGNHSGVDKNAAPFSRKGTPRMASGGRKMRSKGGY